VHDPPRPDDPAAEGVADRLVAQTDPHDRDLRVESPDHVAADPGLLGEQGPGERKIASGFIASISTRVISSFRRTATSSPSWPGTGPGCR